MVDHDLLHAQLAELAVALGQDSDLHDGLHRLGILTMTALGIDGGGITLRMPGGTTGYVTATDSITLAVERRQDELQEGPCIDAIATSEVVTVAAVEDDKPWPSFTAVLLDAGFSAAAGVPICYQGTNIGALNLYSSAARAWTLEDVNAGRLVADLAAGYLVNNEQLRTTSTLAEQLQQALDSRVVIEQAKGVLVGRHGVDPEVAFEVLRQFSRANRRNMHDVAAAIISGSLDPGRPARTAS